MLREIIAASARLAATFAAYGRDQRRLHAQLRKALGDPDMRKRLEANGFEIIGSSPAEFRALLDSDLAPWSRIARARNIRVE